MAAQAKLAASREDVIRASLDILKDLGFTLEESAKILGFTGPLGKDPEYLERELVQMSSVEDADERSELIVEIMFCLGTLFREDFATMKSWLNESQERLCAKEMRALIASGNLEDLRTASRFLYQITG